MRCRGAHPLALRQARPHRCAAACPRRDRLRHKAPTQVAHLSGVDHRAPVVRPHPFGTAGKASGEHAHPSVAAHNAFAVRHNASVIGAHCVVLPADCMCTPDNTIYMRHNAVAIVSNRMRTHVDEVNSYRNRVCRDHNMIVIASHRMCRLAHPITAIAKSLSEFSCLTPNPRPGQSCYPKRFGRAVAGERGPFCPRRASSRARPAVLTSSWPPPPYPRSSSSRSG